MPARRSRWTARRARVARQRPRRGSRTEASSYSTSPRISPTRMGSERSWRRTASGSAAWTCSSTTAASASAPPRPIRDQAHRHDARVNLRAVVLMYREALELLRAAGAEHRLAQVVNVALDCPGKRPRSWLSVYSAAKAGVTAYTQAMNRELAGDGIRSVALCPDWVDTDMTDFLKHRLPGGDDPPRRRGFGRSLRARGSHRPRLCQRSSSSSRAAGSEPSRPVQRR